MMYAGGFAKVEVPSLTILRDDLSVPHISFFSDFSCFLTNNVESEIFYRYYGFFR